MALNGWLLASGILILGLGVFHSILGELFLVRRLLRRDNLPRLFGDESFTKLTIRYAWHLLTILCVAAGAILFHLATLPPTPTGTVVARILSVAFAVSGLWGLAATRARHWSWVVLVAAAVIAWIGAT